MSGVVAGVLVDDADALVIYRALALARKARDPNGGNGISVPDHLLEAFRTSAQRWLSTDVTLSGRVSAGGADIETASISTGQLAERLNVTTRHARRLAEQAGVTRLSRGSYPADVVHRIKERRESR